MKSIDGTCGIHVFCHKSFRGCQSACTSVTSCEKVKWQSRSRSSKMRNPRLIATEKCGALVTSFPDFNYLLHRFSPGNIESGVFSTRSELLRRIIHAAAQITRRSDIGRTEEAFRNLRRQKLQNKRYENFYCFSLDLCVNICKWVLIQEFTTRGRSLSGLANKLVWVFLLVVKKAAKHLGGCQPRDLDPVK